MYGYQIKHSVAVSSYVFYLTRKRFQDCHIIKPSEAVSSSVSSEAYYDVNPPPPHTPLLIYLKALRSLNTFMKLETAWLAAL